LLPFTRKGQLRDNYPYGMFAVPPDQVIRIQASSGTFGKPVVVGYTRRDLANWGAMGARCLAAAGLFPGDRLHNAYDYGLFTGGLGLHGAAESFGVTVIPMSGVQMQKQVMLLADLAPTAMSCTPSYALNIADEADKLDIDIRKLPLRVGLFGAEPWSEEMRHELESRLGIDALDIYGITELMGPGVGVECLEVKKGLHIWEDHFLIECIDIDTGEPLPPGEKGEITITSLTREAFPMMRFRTGDITILDDTPCKCGRTHIKIHRIMGHFDDLLVIHGVDVFPTQIEAILMRTEALSPFYQIEVFRAASLDSLRVNVEARPPLYANGQDYMERVSAKVEKDIKDSIGIPCEVKIHPTGAIERSMGKAVRVVDHRNEKK
jgi:phenylacetate-CoA ligase